ncbi:putative tail fiber protein [Synechococcus phage S-H34]|uniref:Putative tail fiber protein n=1 Tax=Synechococcus phage S-H34 TaxID=2718942 RepID=A0A6G8R6B1_9CAUD|nr:tail collar fiber protein [Synechococcus phage S-H34]QIN96932.1 putative tail fiber protein [Synechococcus phage S-H34]
MAITFPNTPSPGDQYVAENGYTYEYDGEKWSTLPDSEGQIPAGGTTGQFLAKVNNTDYNMEWTDAAPPTSIGTTPPTGDLEDGQLWWRSDTGVLYIYYGDGDSSQWVQAAVGMDTRVQAEVYTGDVPPLGPGEGDLWWNTTDTNLYVYYQSVWVQSNPVPPEQPNYWQRDAATGVVSPSTDGDVLNGIASINGGHAGPNNLIINGAMQVRQRTADIAVSQGLDQTTQGPIDRFRLRHHGDQWAGTLSRGTESVNNEFQHYWRLTTTTPETAVDGVNQLIVEQLFEGYNVAHLNYGNSPAKSLTLSFWVRSSEAGTYIAKLYSLDANRLITKVYTIDSADTWEQKTFVFEGDAAGTIGNNESEGLRVCWQIAAGTDFVSGSTPTTWTAYSNTTWAAGHVQNGVMTNTNATFDLTGVQLTATDTPVAFQHEDYGTTLQKCQRYFIRKTTASDYRVSILRSNSSSSSTVMSLPVQMRTTPTASVVTQPNVKSIRRLDDVNGTNYTNLTVDPRNNLEYSFTVDSAFTEVSQMLVFNAIFDLDAEL